MLRSKNTNALFTLFTIAIPKDPPHTGFGDSPGKRVSLGELQELGYLRTFPAAPPPQTAKFSHVLRPSNGKDKSSQNHSETQTLTRHRPVPLCSLASSSSPPACWHTEAPRSPNPQKHPPRARNKTPCLPSRHAHRPRPHPDLGGAPGRPRAPGSRASSAGSHRHPSLSGSRAGGRPERPGRGPVLLLPQWPRPYPTRPPGPRDLGGMSRGRGRREVAPARTHRGGGERP